MEGLRSLIMIENERTVGAATFTTQPLEPLAYAAPFGWNEEPLLL